METIFLANVVLYLTEFKSLLQFLFVSKKCKEAIQLLHINVNTTCLISTYPLQYVYNQQIFLKEIQLFPHLETLQLDEWNQPLIPYLFLQKNKYFARQHLNIILYGKINSNSLFVSSQIVELRNIILHSPIDCSKFVNLRRASLKLYKQMQISSLFTNRKQRLKYVNLSLNKFMDEQFLKSINEYSFDMFVLILDKKKLICQVHSIRNSIHIPFILVSTFYFPTLPPSVLILSDKFTNIKGRQFPTGFLNHYLPTSLYIPEPHRDDSPKEFDFSLSNFINEIWCDDPNIQLQIPPQTLFYSGHLNESLNNSCYIQTLHLVNVHLPFTVPLTVRSLQLVLCDGLIISNFGEMKVVSMISCSTPFDYASSNSSLQILYVSGITIRHSLGNLKSLRKLSIMNCEIHYDLNRFYPKSILSLSCPSKALPKSLGVAQLKIDNGMNLFLDGYAQLKELELNSFPIKLSFPTSLRSLMLRNIHTKSLSVNKFLSLESIHLFNCKIPSVVLPQTLRLLVLEKSVVGINSFKKVCLKQLIVIDSPIKLYQVNENLEMLYYDNDGFVLDDVNLFFKRLQFPPFNSQNLP